MSNKNALSHDRALLLVLMVFWLFTLNTLSFESNKSFATAMLISIELICQSKGFDRQEIQDDK